MDEVTLLEKAHLVEVIEKLRLLNIIGLIESRDWIELIFPEFAAIRDKESDDLFRSMANIQMGRTVVRESGTTDE